MRTEEEEEEEEEHGQDHSGEIAGKTGQEGSVDGRGGSKATCQQVKTDGPDREVGQEPGGLMMATPPGPSPMGRPPYSRRWSLPPLSSVFKTRPASGILARLDSVESLLEPLVVVHKSPSPAEVVGPRPVGLTRKLRLRGDAAAAAAAGNGQKARQKSAARVYGPPPPRGESMEKFFSAFWPLPA